MHRAHTRAAAMTIATVLLTVVWAPAATAGDVAVAFVARLRAAVASGDRRSVASMFRYPLRVTSPALPLPIPLDNAASTRHMYELLFTPEMRCAIEMAREPQPGQAPPKYPLIVNGGVLNLGAGLIVAERTAGRFRITRMTLTGTPEGRRPGTPANATAIDLRFKGMVRQAAGNLAGDATDRYVVSLTRGAVLQARIERFKGLDAVLQVADSRGRPVDASADGKRTWAGPIPDSGNYHVDVVRKAPFCDPPLTYLLTIAAR